MDDLNLEDATLFFEMMGDISKKWKVSEKKLISIVEKINVGDIKKLAKNHLGINHKRVLQKNIFGPNAGKLRNNNLEKEFIRTWMYKNKRSESMGDNKLVLDNILDRHATDEELVIANSVIQWLGTFGGESFLNDVGYFRNNYGK
jgi:hypothetical protein